MTVPNDGEDIRALTAVAEALERRESKVQRAVEDLRDEVEVQNLHNTHKIRWVIAAAAFAVIVSALVLVGYLKQQDTSSRVVGLVEAQAQTTARLEKIVSQQEVIRNQVLCPLFRVLLGGYQPETRAPGPDRDKYETAFAEMRDQYSVLQCVGDLVPPRSDLVTRPPR